MKNLALRSGKRLNIYAWTYIINLAMFRLEYRFKRLISLLRAGPHEPNHMYWPRLIYFSIVSISCVNNVDVFISDGLARLLKILRYFINAGISV